MTAHPKGQNWSFCDNAREHSHVNNPLRSRVCRACPQPHAIFYQASPEYDQPRRESFKDFALAFVTWTLVILAYIAGAYALAGMA